MKNKRHFLIPCRPHLLVFAVACALAGSAFAQNLPSGFRGVSGVNAPTIAGNTMTVTQTAQRGIAEWQSFSIGSGYGVRFNQPNASSVLLNRVVGNDLSTIAGNITANGHIYLINPNGILFSQGSSVNAGGLIASTLNISNNDFLTGGALKFSRPDGNNAAVINEGSITAAHGGTIGLMAARVTNTGTLSAPGGTVGLVSARTVNVDFDGDGLTTFTIPNDSLASAAWVENSGQVDADGGRIALLAASTVREQVVKQSGTLRARSLSNRGGEIVLGGDTASGNEVLVSGELDVSGNTAGVAGGSVSAEASSVMVEDARIDASGVGQGGSIAVNASAGNVGLFNSRADVSGTRQGGSISVHANSVPDQSSSGIIAMDKDSSLHADATGPRGDGGQIVLIGDAVTRAHGELTARGGSQGGDGGFIETSAEVLELGGIRVNASAPAGKAGEWLLDPYDIFINHGGMGGSLPSNPFTSTVINTIIYDGDINDILNAGTSVTIMTGAGGAQAGNINLASGVEILKISGGDATLTLNAHNDIRDWGNAIIRSTAGALNVVFTAGRQVDYAGSITTNGGFVTMEGSGRDELAGVLLSGATIDTRSGATGGAVSITGTGLGGSSPGVWLRNATRISTATGNVQIRGASLANASGLASYGISIWDGRIETTSGSITLVGSTQGENWTGGLWLRTDSAGSMITSTNGGRIDVTGAGTAVAGTGVFGISIDSGSRINGSGDVILRASNNGAGDALRINGRVSANNVLNLRPGGVDAAGNAVDRPSDQILFSLTGGAVEDHGTGFSISGSELTRLSASTIVVGGSMHNGNITVNGSLTASSPLTLQNGSGGITLRAPIRASTLGLYSVGNITQSSSGAPITANNLFVRSGTGSVDLRGTNNVNRLNGEAAGGFTFINSGALTISPFSVTGYDIAAQSISTATPGTMTADSVRVQTYAGDLTLAMTITSILGTDLVAGWRFQNPGTGSINGPWRVWAGTWINETRGGMVGTGDDILDCVYGGGCMVGAGNYFIYAPQSLVLQLPDAVRESDQHAFEWLQWMEDYEDENERSERASELEGGVQDSEPGFGFVLICLDTLLSGSAVDAGHNNDILDREWSRVRAKPQASNCLGVDGRKGCASF
ncbi:MAG: filamentous hemagglutinin N-terminal domain-containing protein [Betaproteobacteria bacterium]|nr:filamentous hemagglutinin N-terminal domain-containing protein [Betaproteobacteria bacterium]